MGVVCCFLFMCVCVSDSSLPSLLAFPYSSYLYGTSNKDTHFKPGPGPQFLRQPPPPTPVLEYQCTWYHPSSALPGSEAHGAVEMEVGKWGVGPGCRGEALLRGGRGLGGLGREGMGSGP